MFYLGVFVQFGFLFVLGQQAGVQAPVVGATVPGVAAGDFEAEYRGALEHARSSVLHALHAALSSGKVCFHTTKFNMFFFSFVFYRLPLTMLQLHTFWKLLKRKRLQVKVQNTHKVLCRTLLIWLYQSIRSETHLSLPSSALQLNFLPFCSFFLSLFPKHNRSFNFLTSHFTNLSIPRYLCS